MDTAFFIVCKIYIRLVLSKQWIRREYHFESRNCDVLSRSAKNVVNKNTAYSGQFQPGTGLQQVLPQF